MKITIEFNSSYEAKVNIDERILTFGYSKGVWRWEGIQKDEYDSTIGGIVCGALTSKLIDILQNWQPEYDNPETGECWKTWEKLDDECADKVYEMQ